MSKLIYHTVESAAGGPSPFHEAVVATVTGQDVLIACPYLGPGYLERITGLARGGRC